jgi:hypothetical protein
MNSFDRLAPVPVFFRMKAAPKKAAVKLSTAGF